LNELKKNPELLRDFYYNLLSKLVQPPPLMQSIPFCLRIEVACALLIPDLQQAIMGLFHFLMVSTCPFKVCKAIFFEPLICPSLNSAGVLTSKIIAPF